MTLTIVSDNIVIVYSYSLISLLLVDSLHIYIYIYCLQTNIIDQEDCNLTENIRMLSHNVSIYLDISLERA